MRNAIFIIFSQQILSGGLLLVIMNEQKSNLSCKFKLEPITTYYLWFAVKMLYRKFWLLTFKLECFMRARANVLLV